MKQLLGILFVLGALLFNSNITNAQVGATGGCLPGHKYSSTTGQPCSTLITVFPPGCTSNQGYSSTTGNPCNDANNSVVIIGVSGPQTLNVNQQGTWTVSAYDKNGGRLSYSVLWGDEELGPQNIPIPDSPISYSGQSATFTHGYFYVGNFTPTFTVTSPNTINCFRAPCPGNGGSASTSLSVNVGNTISVKPDVQISDVSCTPLNPKSSEMITCYLNVTNASSVKITKPFSINSQGSDVRVSAPLNAWEVKKVGPLPPFGLSIAGRNELVFIADMRNEIDELHEDNNEVYYYIYVGDQSQPSIKVISPNGGESLALGTTNYIKWSANNVPSGAVVSITLVDEATYIDDTQYTNSYTVVTNYCGSYGGTCVSASAGSYKWTIPNDISLGKYRVLVTCMIKNSERGCDISSKDFSNAPFTITSGTTSSPKLIANSLKIIGGQSSYTPGQTIKFSAKGIASNGKPGTPSQGFNVQSSMKASDPVYGFVPVIINGVYQSFNATYNYNTSLWDIVMTAPSDASKTYTIDTAFYCSNSAASCASGQIDKSFNFTLPSTTQAFFRVVSPNGGETWTQGKEYLIKWSSSGVSNVTAFLVPYDSPGNGVGSLGLIGSVSKGNTLYWDPQTVWDSSINGKPSTVPGGAYKIYLVGTIDGVLEQSVSDMSDDYFKIAGGTTTVPAVNAVGVLDTADCSIIGGWAVNTDKKTDSMYINIYDEKSGSKNLLSRVLTSGSRPDVNNALGITGNHGFTISTPNSIKDGNAHNISVYAEGSNTALTNSPKSVTCNVLGEESFTFTLPLKKGSTGSEVMELQKFLNKNGYDAGLVDGLFGTQVHNALVKLQVANGLTADGIVGPLVRAILNK